LKESNNNTNDASRIPVLNNMAKNKNKVQEINTDDAYLQMKLNSVSTAKARKILPNPPKEIIKEVAPKEIKKEPLKIEKTINLKPNPIINNNINSVNKAKAEEKPAKNPEEHNNIEEKLYECTEGCGRKFNTKALEKHVKVCKKVFQSKPQKAEKEVKKTTATDNLKKTDNNNGKKGKWQKQSEAFRAVIKAAKNQFGDEEQKPVVEKKDNKKKTKK